VQAIRTNKQDELEPEKDDSGPSPIQTPMQQVRGQNSLYFREVQVDSKVQGAED
jgi:hypothetical protein